MISNLDKNIGKWNFPIVGWKTVAKFRNQTSTAPFGVDDPDTCRYGSDFWHQHPIQNFDYQFNNWGFRDQNFDQYRKDNSNCRVNICIGDSYTLNIGGPQYHSWPHLLGKYFDTPTLNFGVDRLPVDYFRPFVDKIRTLFDVDKVFVLANLFADHHSIVLRPHTEIEKKCKFLQAHCWIPNAHWQFIPPWCFDQAELKYLYHYFPNAHNYLRGLVVDFRQVDLTLLRLSWPVRQKYLELSGSSWMPYEEFCQQYLLGHDMTDFFTNVTDKKLIQHFVITYMYPAARCALYYSRDAMHMNQKLNQRLADYFYQQSCLSNAS